LAPTPGTRLGAYEVTALIGEGGMGQVYRARDTKLNRDVALKVLPDLFASDTERLGRFTREAQTLASLNHPNIAHIHGFEESGGVHALVMELVEGEDLSQRIARGAIPLDEALPIAEQIAQALEAAHEQGIIHRDLKPANIKVRPDGRVKILDFGLAKAMESTGAMPPNVSQSPTITTPAMTQAGMILGTAAYMSPEQAAGKTVDKRSDLWAFGVVVLEMLTGRPVFTGDTVLQVLASVLKSDPDWTTLPATTPAALRRLLRRCLEKDRKRRLDSAADARLEIEEALTAPAVEMAQGTASVTAPRRLPWIALGAAAAVGMVAMTVPTVRHLREGPPEEPSVYLAVPLPANSTVTFLEMSPDGRRLLVSMLRDGKVQIYLRSLNSPEWQPLPGTDNARAPFWSPDSRFIGFFADGALNVIPAAGGPVRELCSEAGLGAGGTWSPGGVILFASDNGRLRRVNVAGGSCAPVGEDDPKRSARLPVFLPDGHHFFYEGATRGDAASRGIYLAALDDLTPRKILAGNSGVVYAPPVAGGRAHLLFLRDTTLMAQPFDVATLEAVADPFPVASHATTTLTGLQVAASVSNGTLVYLTGGSRETQLTWFDRAGKALGKVGGPGAEQRGVVLSPDGNAVLINRRELNGQYALWLYDLVRGSESRFLPPGTQSGAPVWFPDGRRVLFSMTTPPAGLGLYQKDMSGGGQPELVAPMAAVTSFVLSAFSPDGRFLVYTVVDPKTRGDIWYVPWDAKLDLGKAVKFVVTEAIESQGQVSPDGKWIAYTSDTTGAFEVYVRPFPTGPGVWKVSVDGGGEPRWSADGKQLYYVRLLTYERATLLSSPMEADGQGGLRTGTPQALFDIRSRTVNAQVNVFDYSPHPDGQRFLVSALVAEEGEPTINVITHWQKTVSDRKVP
jgi:eukaryotic-like serine/threonine-protein kinase